MTNLSVITDNSLGSYNQAVAKINQNQKENVRKLNQALNSVNLQNAALQSQINSLAASVWVLKQQVFRNQVYIDNWSRDAPYVYDISILNLTV